MDATEKVINDLNVAKLILCQPQMLTPEMCIKIGQAITSALALLKAQEPRVMTFEEVKEKINSGEYVFTECEKERQWVRYGNAKLSVDQGDSCIIAFLSSGSREDNPHAIWWWVSYKNYNKTWRCWTIPLTYAQMEAVKWDA